MFLVIAHQLLHHPLRIVQIQLHATQHVAAVEDALVQTLYDRMLGYIV